MAGVRVVIYREDGAICCVRHGYGVKDWNVPGGGIDQGESLLDAVYREVLEETNQRIRIDGLVGLYSVPESRDLMALFAATLLSSETWTPNGEIVEMDYFQIDSLPQPMHPCVVRCLRDAAEGRRGVVRVLDLDGSVTAEIDRVM